MAFQNVTKHDRVCQSVTEIKDHAKNFPNAPRISLCDQCGSEMFGPKGII